MKHTTTAILIVTIIATVAAAAIPERINAVAIAAPPAPADRIGPPAWQSMPAAGYVTDCKVIDVYDGDTLTVEVTKVVRIRLLDCWAPEIRGGDEDSRRSGEAAKRYLQSITKGVAARLFVPAGEQHIGQATSLSRILGQIWMADHPDRSIAQRMVEAGYATRTKKDER